MGLNVRLNNLDIPNTFTVEYSGGGSVGYVTFGTFSASTTSVVITNLQFDTKYFIRVTDTVQNISSKTIIYTNESKYYECYDTIDFYIDISGDTCANKIVKIYDLFSGNTNYGNHSSVINGIPNSYRIYTGLTYEISASTFVTTATTNPSTGLVYQFNNSIPTHIPIYVFLEHGDGSIENNTLTNPKKQGGFQVRTVFIACPVCFNHKCDSGDTQYSQILYYPMGVYNQRPYYRICCDEYYVFWNNTNNRWEVRDNLGSGTLHSILEYNNNYPVSVPPTYMWSAITTNVGEVFFSSIDTCPPECDFEVTSFATVTPTPTLTPTPTVTPTNTPTNTVTPTITTSPTVSATLGGSPTPTPTKTTTPTVTPTNTPTVTPTKTTTPTPIVYYYFADQYDCGDCGGSPLATNVEVAINNVSNAGVGTWYITIGSVIPGDFSYQIVSGPHASSPSGQPILDANTGSTSCNDTCNGGPP